MDPITGEALKAVTGAADSLKSGGQAVASGALGKGTQSKAEGKPAARYYLDHPHTPKIDCDWDTSLCRGERVRQQLLGILEPRCHLVGS